MRSRAGHPHRRGYLIRPTAHQTIVNGVDADQADWGFAAFVVHNASPDNPDFYCSGTLISPRVVLTAGHCATADSTNDPLDPGGYQVVTGSVDLSDVPASHVFSVSQVVVNPHYDWHDYSGDAALLVLSKPSTAPALRLARPDETDLYTPGTVAEIAGWGLDGYGNSSALLQAASTTVKGPNYCERYSDWYTETWETCAVDEPSLATGTCNGDSGGPLLTTRCLGAAGRDRRYERRADQLQHLHRGLLHSSRSAVEVGERARRLAHEHISAATTPPPPRARRRRRRRPRPPRQRQTTTTTTTKTTPASTQARAPKPLPTLPTLTMSEARSYAATMVHARTHKRPHLTLSCSRTSKWTVHCSIRLAVRRRHLRGQRPVLPLPPGTSCVLVVRLHGHAPLALVPGRTREPNLHGICPAVPLGVTTS